MTATAAFHEEVIASCSFCAKPDTEVQRLVAGPGVFICNECVELAAWVVEDASRATSEEASRRRSEYRNRSTDDILAMLPPLVRSAERVEAELAQCIGRLREGGVDWQTIAGAAGIGAEDARRRFGAAAAE